MELCQFPVDRLAEPGDLVLIAHVDGDRNCSAASPMTFGILPRVVVQIVGRAPVAAAYIDQVAQVDRSACPRRRYNDVTDRIGTLELPRRIQGDLPLSRLKNPARRDNIAGLNQLVKIASLQPVGGEPILGEFEINCLLLHPSTLHLRRLGSALHGAGDEVREIIKLCVTVFVTRGLRQLLACFCWIVNDDRLPGIGMQLRSLQLVGKEVFDKRLDRRVVLIARAVKSNETCSLNQSGVAEHAGSYRLCFEEYGSTRGASRRNRFWKRVDDRDRLCLGCGLLDGASRADRCLNGLRPEIDLYRVCLRARDGQHQCCRIPKVALESNGSGSLGELAVKSVEF